MDTIAATTDNPAEPVSVENSNQKWSGLCAVAECMVRHLGNGGMPLKWAFPIGRGNFSRMAVQIMYGEKQEAQTLTLDYKDTRETNRWRREMRAINAWLRASPITSIVEDDSRAIRLDKDGQPIEPYRRTLRRIFNNRDWNAGGGCMTVSG
jgi:hypothetical protein